MTIMQSSSDSSMPYSRTLYDIQKTIKASHSPHAQLIIVSKNQSIERIKPYLELGHRHFAENRPHEIQEKWTRLRHDYPDIVLHFIGHLQSNKAYEVASCCDMIHSLDRISLIHAIAKAAQKLNRRISCLLQINTGREAQKSGAMIEDIPHLLSECKNLDLSIQGLMCIPPARDIASLHFALLQTLKNEFHLSTCSMGMSSDYTEALAIGTDYIRIGSLFFPPVL
jgi:pyridoxal phosphate enzyme (YggS family)